ncbi:MAG TPA: methylated-DNA--[protein]-cysteine S-methyltransferase [Thermoanaerobaculia bacterium]|nr:methylated-DNA--[protein]-cysteine S-methyltransferase [Thermoanaerobaculia bacterium]
MSRIDALRTGELAGVEQRSVEDHLRKCSSCDESVDDVRQLAKALKGLALAPPRALRDALRLADSYDELDGVWVAFSDRGIRLIHKGSFEEFQALYAKRYGAALERRTIPEELKRQVAAARSGEAVQKPKLDVESRSELEAAVVAALRTIPRGEVRSYSWLAQQVGRPKAVRAVANFVAGNIVPYLVPCHRVVPAGGGVGKYAYGSSAKRELLRREGVDVDALDALARQHVRFIGSKTTHIFCFPTCRDARRIREENRVPFHDTGDALKKGFRPCRRCLPAA